jgi:hypothetical protein
MVSEVVAFDTDGGAMAEQITLAIDGVTGDIRSEVLMTSARLDVVAPLGNGFTAGTGRPGPISLTGEIDGSVVQLISRCVQGLRATSATVAARSGALQANGLRPSFMTHVVDGAVVNAVVLSSASDRVPTIEVVIGSRSSTTTTVTTVAGTFTATGTTTP